MGDGSEETCTLYSSRGLLKSCKHHDPDPRSSQYVQERIDFGSVRRGESVYICITALRSFIAIQFPQIQEPFILVTGDGDEIAPFDVFESPEAALVFLDHPKILHWYGVNGVVDHPKFTRIPYGLDYHTCRHETSWGPAMTPVEQEALLHSIAAAAAAAASRKPLIYWNIFAVSQRRFGGDRELAREQIPADLMWCEPAVVPREETWRRQTEYAFVASPHSNGLDCIRTWEALVLGCIPIVCSSPIDPVYEGLPVLIVPRWSDVTRELLDKTFAKFQTRTWELERLTLAYWVGRIHTAEAGAGTQRLKSSV